MRNQAQTGEPEHDCAEMICPHGECFGCSACPDCMDLDDESDLGQDEGGEG